LSRLFLPFNSAPALPLH